MPWTLFWDMNSGGKQKEDFKYCYIQAKEEKAISIFYSRFGHDPNNVTCSCCGEDYYVSIHRTLSEASGFHRGCAWDSKKEIYVDKPDKGKYSKKYIPLREYRKQEDVLIIPKKDIKEKERHVEVPIY